MKILKLLVCVQALLVVYFVRENSEMRDQIKSSAEATSQASKTIEKMNATIRNLEVIDRNCQYTVNKYNEQIRQMEEQR